MKTGGAWTFSAFLLVVSSYAHAVSVSVAPVAPYAFDTSGDLNYSIHTTAPIDLGEGYKRLSSTATATSPLSSLPQNDDAVIRLSVTTDANSPGSGSYFVASIFFEGTSGNWFVVPLTYAWSAPCVVNNTCQRYGTASPITSMLTQAVIGTPASGETNFEIGIYMLDICKGAQAAGESISGCSAGAVSAPGSGSGVTLNFKVVVDDVSNTTTDIDPSGGTSSDTHSLKVWNTQPSTFSCPNLSYVYYPGDGEILVDSNLFRDSGSTLPADRLMVVGKAGGTPNTGTGFYSQAPIGRLNLTSSDWQTMGGFTNSDATTAVSYTLAFGLRDASGAVQFSGPCTLSGVKTAAIFGLLKAGKCFIATGAFRDENHPAVRVLREFRNQFLLTSKAGRALVHFYYQVSPGAAVWLLENSWARYPVIVALTPFIAVAWVFTHGLSILGFLVVVALLFFLLHRMNQKKKAAALMIAVVMLAQPGQTLAADVETPYLDAIKQSLEPSAAPSGSYTQSELKKLKEQGQEAASSEGYTEATRQMLNEQASDETTAKSSTHYTQRERSKLEPLSQRQKESTIQSVLNGGGELHEKKEGQPRQQWGFNVGASVNRNITADSEDGATSDFNTVYTDNWMPEVHVFYEYQFLKHDYAGSLGLFTSFGASYAQGYGKYAITLTNPTTGETFDDSLVKFKFISFPLSLGLKYTLGLFDAVQPYVIGGGALVGYAEMRSDRTDVLKGYTPGARGSVGLNILIDSATPSRGWDLYLENGIHHTYLTFDFTYWVARGDVSFENKAINVGLSYDF